MIMNENSVYLATERWADRQTDVHGSIDMSTDLEQGDYILLIPVILISKL